MHKVLGPQQSSPIFWNNVTPHMSGRVISKFNRCPDLVLSAGRGAPAVAWLGEEVGEGACRGDRDGCEAGCWPRDIICNACANSGGTGAPERRNNASWSMPAACAQRGVSPTGFWSNKRIACWFLQRV